MEPPKVSLSQRAASYASNGLLSSSADANKELLSLMQVSVELSDLSVLIVAFRFRRMYFGLDAKFFNRLQLLGLHGRDT